MDMMHELSFAVAPFAPSNLTANLQGNIAYLVWNDNSISETNYTIQRANSLVGPWTNLTILPGTKTRGSMNYDDGTVVQNITYYYKIIANNIVGDTLTPGFPIVQADSVPSNIVNVGNGIVCQTSADTNNDGIISMPELLVYIQGWKHGTVTMPHLLMAINFWKVGVGC
jgi:hypothetical protein